MVKQYIKSIILWAPVCWLCGSGLLLAQTPIQFHHADTILRVALTPSVGAVKTTSQSQTNPLTYQAKHDHFPFGSCQGTLTVEETRITYDSPGKPEHSRQWQLQDIKEIKQKGPYRLKVETLRGEKYNFEIGGAGIDIKEFKLLLARIAAARAGR